MRKYDPNGVPVNCMLCRHFDAGTMMTCAAYPDGIPLEILSGDVQHSDPLEGDHDIQFEAEPEAIAEYRPKSGYQAAFDSMIQVPTGVTVNPPAFDPIQAQISLQLKRTIDTVYEGGIDRIGSFWMDDEGMILGSFIADRKPYYFVVTPTNSIRYVETEVLKQDSVNIGRSTRGDAGKSKKCGVGKPCGGTCIAKGLICDRRLGSASVERLNNTRNAIRSTQKVIAGKDGVNLKIATAALAASALGAVVGANAATMYAQAFAPSRPMHMQQNQKYSSVFPSDKQFAKAEFRSPKPVHSNEKVIGINRRYTVKVGNEEFFAKHSSEASISKGIFAYDAAVALGLEKNVLPTRRIYRNGSPLAASPLLDPDDIRSLGDDKKLREFVKRMPKKDLSEAVLFDYTIHQYDRHAGNFLVRKDDSVLLIDNEATVWDLKIPKPLDWIPRGKNPPQSVSNRLDTKKNFFFKYGMGANPNYQVSESVLNRFVSRRKEVREIMSYRYSGLDKAFVDENLRQLDRRFDVMESMLKTGDRRVKYLIDGQLAVKKDSVLVKPSPETVRRALLTVKAVLEEQYGQIDQFVGLPVVKNGLVQGVFRDSGKLFSFEISPDGDIQYQQNSRADSYLSGYVVGDIAAYLPDEIVDELVESSLSRTDTLPRTDAKKRCVKGLSCGNTCLPQGSKCRVSLPPKRRRELNRAAVVLKQSDLSGVALGGGLILGTAALSGAAATGLAVSAANQRSANETLKQAEEERRRAEEAVKMAREYLEKAKEEREAARREREAKNKVPALNRVAASAIEAGIPAALGGLAGGPIGVAAAGATAAGIAAVREYGKISSERLREGGSIIPEDPAERIALGAVTLGGATATGYAVHQQYKRRQQRQQPPAANENKEENP